MELPVINTQANSPEVHSINAFFVIGIILLCVLLAAIVIGVGIYIHKKRGKNKTSRENAGERVVSNQAIVLKPSENNTIDEMNVGRGGATYPTLILENLDHPGVRYEVKLKGCIVIGQNEDSDIVIDDTAVSRVHCKVTRQGNIYSLEDCNSTNGTIYNGFPVSGEMIIESSGIIEIGRWKYRLTIS